MKLTPLRTLVLLSALALLWSAKAPEWGFFGHRRINRLAVLTLPPEMMVFFKPNIDWLTDHAPDPDMRRYATTWEAPRHYIDLDNYGTTPYENLPRHWGEALRQYTDLWAVTAAGDTVQLYKAGSEMPASFEDPYRHYFAREVAPRFYEDKADLNVDSLNAFLVSIGSQAGYKAAFYKERLSEHGILPWNLERMTGQLTGAFRRRDSRKILRLCADIGHYIADAHVPLHTCSNYNGQKSGQHGIHGFWESRIPELFADDQYDYFVGKPEYIDHPDQFFWSAVLESNRLVDSVLFLEKQLRQTFPADLQICPDTRNGRVVVVQCRDFAAAYQDALNGMVERRMRAAIHAVSSIWYTAWVDAGQPDLSEMDVAPLSAEEMLQEEKLKQMYEQGKILGRPEEH